MALHKDDIHKIADLARLTVAEQDVPRYITELSNILEFVARMNSVETEQVTAMAHPMDEHQRLRPDVVTEKDQRELFQRATEHVRDGLYLVPKVIE